MFRSIALFNKGKVSKWFHQKRYGFIVEEGTNKSYFVHRQGLNVPEGAVRALSIGQEVEFEIAKDDDDREKAVGVTAVGGGPPQAPRPPQRQFDDRRPRQQGDRGGYDRGGRSSDNNGQRHDKQSIKHNDPYTWPKDLEVEDTRAILRGKVSENTPVNYYVLTALRRTNMFDQLLEELQKIIKQPPSGRVNAEEYLCEYWNNQNFPCSMPLQDRVDPRDELTEFLNRDYKGSEKRCIISCFSPRGSGKTQFIKHYFFKFHEEAIKHGRVIVRCCGNAQNESWMKLVKAGEEGKQPLDHATAGLCELIRSHVQSVTGRDQQKSDYDTNKKAYASWIRETKSHFNIRDGVTMDPLIVLDTCEVLGETDCKHEVHKTARPGTPYTLLELFCSAIPSPRKIFVIGCNARMQYGDVAATLANIDKMQPLQPLSEEAHKNAVVSWGQGVKGWGIDAAVCKPIYHWAAGLPRLLLESHSKFSGTMSLANGSVKAVHRCFGEFQKRASSLYEIRPEWFPYAVSCLLISSTKLKVSNPDNRIPINPDWKKFLGVSWGEGGTFRQAAGHSIGSYNSKDELFVVPPIIFSDDVMKSLMVEDCGNGKMKKVQDTLILPSQLHPYFTEAVAEQLGRSSPTERGKQFEKPFLYAVYARYLLAYWGNTDSKWVPLTQVFEGAFQQQQEDVMKGYEVNLSGGVHVALTELLYSNAVPNAITYFGSSAHHDAYIYCRTVDDGSGVVWEGAVPLQLRHGRPKSYDELKPQLMTIRVPKLGKQKKSDEGTKAPPAPQPEPVRLLLSVNHKQRDPIRDEEKIVMIDADKMSSIAWLWLLAPGEQ